MSFTSSSFTNLLSYQRPQQLEQTENAADLKLTTQAITRYCGKRYSTYDLDAMFSRLHRTVLASKVADFHSHFIKLQQTRNPLFAELCAKRMNACLSSNSIEIVSSTKPLAQGQIRHCYYVLMNCHHSFCIAKFVEQPMPLPQLITLQNKSKPIVNTQARPHRAMPLSPLLPVDEKEKPTPAQSSITPPPKRQVRPWQTKNPPFVNPKTFPPSKANKPLPRSRRVCSVFKVMPFERPPSSVFLARLHAKK